MDSCSVIGTLHDGVKDTNMVCVLLKMGSFIVIVKAILILIFQAVFAVTICPLVYFNIQKTKYLQIFTTVMRWLGKDKPLL